MALTKIPASFLDKSAHVDFADNEKIRLGTSQDLEIYSDGTHSRIYESGSGLLIIRAGNFNINNADGSQSYITMSDGGATTLYHAGAAKLATASGGASVTGNLAVSGNLTVSGTTTELDTTNLNVTDKNITLNYHASSDTSSNANGAGLTIQDAVNASTDATILWDATNDEFDFSHKINIPTLSTGTITSTGHLSMAADNSTIYLGAGLDLRLYHDGNSKITDTNAASDLLIQSNNIVLEETDGTNMIHCAGGGAVQLYHNGTSKLHTSSGGVDVHMDTDKVLRFSGGISEIGSVPGFQTTNTAGSANTDFGIRATTIRFATGSSEKVRVAAAGHLEFNPVNSFAALNNSILSSSNTYMYMMGGAAGLYLADNANLSNSIGIRNADFIDFNVAGSERMRANSNGLEIADGKRIVTKTTNGEAIRFERSSDSLRYSSIDVNSTDAGGAFIKLKVHTGASATSLADVITARGNGYVDMAGASDVRLTLASTGTAGNNDSNWIRGSSGDLMYNAATGHHKWEIGGTEHMRVGKDSEGHGGCLALGSTTFGPSVGDIGPTLKVSSDNFITDCGIVLDPDAGEWTLYAYNNYLSLASTDGSWVQRLRWDKTTSASVPSMTISDAQPWIDMVAPDGATFKAGITMRGGSSSTQAQAHFHLTRDSGYRTLSTAGNYDVYLDTTTANTAYGNFLFGTDNTEAMRIHATDQSVSIGNQDVIGSGSKTYLSVGDGSGNATLTIYTGSSNYGYLNFADGTSGASADPGYIRYNHNNNDLYTNRNFSGPSFSSDISRKENISDISDGWAVIKDLRPRTFDWKKDELENAHLHGMGTGVAGFIAQELETVLPNEVHGEEGEKGIAPFGIMAHLVKTVQQQQTIIDDLKSRIETLEG